MKPIININIIIILIISLVLFLKLSKKEVQYVVSDIDGKKYLVRNLKDKQKAANMLARIRKNIEILTNHLVEYKDTKYQDFKEYIEALSRRINNIIINESSEDSVYTSYSINKGEQLVFCLRSKKNKNKIHDLNLLMYVVLHEMAHIASPEYGHTELFKKIFAFFTKVAIEIGLYTYIPFFIEPTEYCGLIISESII